MSSASGWKMPGYVAESLIGYGASGQVWRGRSVRSGQPVALKRIESADPARRRAVEAEAALLSALEHPNLLRLHDLVADGDVLVLVLDLAEGGSLAELLDRRQRLTAGEVVTALAPIASALAYAHDEGVTHCDVSPANVLFTAAGVPLLADLGTARLLGDTALPHATLPYLDPTVAGGGAPAAASDVFALAAVALKALSGGPAWTGSSSEDLLAQAAAGEIADLDSRLQSVPLEVAQVVRRALAGEPYARGTAAEFALDLRHAAHPVPVELSAGRTTEAVRSAEEDAVRRGRHAQPSRPVARTHSARTETKGAPASEGPSQRLIFDRPAFDRPAFDRPGSISDGREEPGPAALALTHAVRGRVRPLLSPPSRLERLRELGGRMRGRERPGGRVGLMVVLVLALVAGAGLMWWPGSSRSGAARSATSATTAAMSPTVAKAVARSASAPAGSSSPRSAAEWTAVLAGLDAQRERAFASRDPDLLAKVYVDGPLLRQDVSALTRQVPAGCRVLGLRTAYIGVAIVARTARGVTLRVTASLSRAPLTCGSVVASYTVARAATRVTVDLLAQESGYRISRMSAAV